MLKTSWKWESILKNNYLDQMWLHIFKKVYNVFFLDNLLNWKMLTEHLMTTISDINKYLRNLVFWMRNFEKYTSLDFGWMHFQRRGGWRGEWWRGGGGGGKKREKLVS